MATREEIFCPSFAQLQAQYSNPDDVYRPTMDEEEGSGDSENECFGVNPAPSTGVTNDLADIGLSTETPPYVQTDSGSLGKRKRVQRSGQKKKQKMPAAKQIADAISVIANASKQRAGTISEIRDKSVDTVINDLFDFEEIKCDEEFGVKCMTLLLDKTNWDMFVAAAKRNKQYLIAWLRYMVIPAMANLMDEEDDDSQVLALIDEESTEYEQLTALLYQYWVPFMCKEPSKTSQHTGHLWVQEKLVEHGLRNSKSVDVEEMVAMFLLTIGHGVRNRVVQELFQHSGETVSRLLHKVLQACFSLATEIIKPCNPQFKGCHPKILNDPRYYLYFKDAIGTIDGTHIKCVITCPNRDKYISRKGYPTQNVMAVCDRDMCFIFVLAGWEGTAHDTRVFHSAVSNLDMNFPHPPAGKYYLVDAGYPTPVGYLGPYKCERYHLPEFRRQPAFGSAKETFNFYHSSLRSTIKRTFGVWKNRFHLLQNMRKYSYQTQVCLVCAMMAVHNFIRRNFQSDVTFQEAEVGDFHHEDNNNTAQDVVSSTNYVGTSSNCMNRIRDIIRDQLVRDM